MSIAPGTRLGAYEVVSLLGAGGMGEVYRARDTRLQREVAIKVLPPAFADDPDRLARFEREAQLLASLNHPNIAAIYGVEEKALVLELVDGPTLADRIERGPVPLDEALPIATQIAEALEAAHEQGVIHRDLKPANIKLRDDGTVKVLDFGLAKLHDPNAAQTPSSRVLATLSPTVLSPAATQIGIILGTAAYMSPEQAKGRPADRRADMWAFGCVLFEMLTGRRVFDGDDVTDFVVAVLSREPDWTLLPAATPPSVERLIRRCLAKDRRERLADAATARLELADASRAPAALPAANAVGARRAWLPWGIAAAAVIAAAVVIATRSPTPPTVARAVHFGLTAPEGTTLPPGFSTYAVSPDGQRIAFEAESAGSRRSLWVRRLDSAAATQVPGTDGARIAAWSFDGASLAFIAAGKLRRTEVAGGGAQTLADATNVGVAWGAGNVILYGVNEGSEGLRSIPAGGGASVSVTTIDKSRGEVAHASPHFLPDGRRFLYLAVNNDPNASVVVLASLDGGERRVILSGTSNAVYSDGYLLFVRDGALMAQSFAEDQGVLTGQPVVISESVKQAPNGRAAFAVAGGTVVFDASREFAEAEFAMLSRQGVETAMFGVRTPSHTMWPSPDFRRVVVESGGSVGSTDLWIVDGDRKSRTRLTDGANTEGHPAWSPDGKQIAFFEGLVGVRSRLVVAAATGIGAPRVVVDTPTYKQVTDWSRDSKLLVFEEQNATTNWDLGVLPVDGSAPPKMVVNTRFSERLGALSPDGRFLAYTSNETGQPEVYVVNFPDVSEKWPVSAGGGTKPRWRGDGGELFFLSGSSALMSVTIKTGTGFAPSVPQRLFALEVIGSDGWDYAVSADGQRFLAMRYSGTGVAGSVSVIADWPASLRK
jgi:Tol biopolymer transport system component